MDKAVVVLVFLITGYQYFVGILMHFCRKCARILGLWVCKVFFKNIFYKYIIKDNHPFVNAINIPLINFQSKHYNIGICCFYALIPHSNKEKEQSLVGSESG